VLVCPDCQQGAQWLSELDHCTRCGSEQLARILGETLCRSCGKQGAAAGSPALGTAAGSSAAGTGAESQAADRATGAVGLPEQRVAAAGTGAEPGTPATAVVGTDLSAEVADALDRIFHRK